MGRGWRACVRRAWNRDGGRIEGRIGSLEEGKREREREKADRGSERDSFQSVSLERGRVSRARNGRRTRGGPELGGGGEGR